MLAKELFSRVSDPSSEVDVELLEKIVSDLAVRDLVSCRDNLVGQDLREDLHESLRKNIVVANSDEAKSLSVAELNLVVLVDGDLNLTIVPDVLQDDIDDALEHRGRKAPELVHHQDDEVCLVHVGEEVLELFEHD